MIGMQSRFSAALHQTGNQLAFAGYVRDKTEDALPGGIFRPTDSCIRPGLWPRPTARKDSDKYSFGSYDIPFPSP